MWQVLCPWSCPCVLHLLQGPVPEGAQGCPVVLRVPCGPPGLACPPLSPLAAPVTLNGTESVHRLGEEKILGGPQGRQRQGEGADLAVPACSQLPWQCL